MMGGLSFSSAAPVGSVAADLGRDEPSLGMECIFLRVTWLSPLPVGKLQKACMGWWQSSPLSPCRGSEVSPQAPLGWPTLACGSCRAIS